MKVYYANGKLKREIWINKDDSLGKFKEYYETGELMSEGIYDQGVIQKIHYSKDGNLKEIGTLENGVRSGWWNSFDGLSNLISSIEYLSKNDTLYENQSIYFLSNGEIDYDKSSFFEVHLPDTIILGKNRISIDYHSNTKDFTERYMYAIIENEYLENGNKIDSFIEFDEDFSVGILANKAGEKMIETTILEQIVQVNKDSTELSIINNKKHFKKMVFVKDTINAPK